MTLENETGMTTCTIIAASTLQALRLLREQLGPDAFVVSSTATAEGVEIVASLQEPAAGPAANATPAAPAAAPLTARLVVSAPGASPESGPVAQGDSSEGSILREIHSMRGMLEDQLAGLAWNEGQRRDPLRGQMLRTLLGAGFSARLAKDLLANLPAGLDHAGGLAHIKAAMAGQIPVLEDEDALMNEGGVYALMGPTGVGKTTTTAKLAARCVMRFGAEKLALITTDSYRIGAYEQLRIYGQILGVAVHAVRNAADLEHVLASLHDKHMVLIDTVGMSQRDRAVSAQISMLCGASRPVRRLLLLNASSHGDTLNEVVQAYRHGGAQASSDTDLAGCILTKVDESTHPGALLDVVIRHQLPIYYVSSGQKVPENLMIGNRQLLIDSVFAARSQSSLFIPGEADLDEQPAALRNEAKVAAAEAVSRRLRSQCQQLIKTLAHSAQELLANALALADGNIGFDQTRSLWRKLSDGQATQGEMAQTLLAQAGVDSRLHCSDYVLASHGATGMPTNEPAGLHVRVTALLSDCTGQAFAAPLSAAAVNAVEGLPDVLDLHQLDHKPVVHLFAAMARPEQVQSWQAADLRWVAPAPPDLLVELAEDGLSATLQELVYGLEFSIPKPVTFCGTAQLMSVAEMLVNLCPKSLPGSGRTGMPVNASMQRCVVTRIVDAANGRLVSHSYLLVSVNIHAKAEQLVQWAAWQMNVQPYFTLIEQAELQLWDDGAAGDAAMRIRKLFAAQACLTVFRLQQVQQSWAVTASKVLAQLAGQPADADQPVPGPVLFQGLGKLYVLLDALQLDDAAAGIPVHLNPVAR